MLITGANGFIGHAVCHTLRKSGHTLSGTSRDQSLRTGPEHIPLYHVPDIGSETDWTQPLKGADAVVHLAAQVHVMTEHSASSLAEHRRANRDGTKQLAEAAANSGVKRLVFISTVKVNGEVTTHRSFSETDTPAPDDPYAISKWEAEQSLVEIGQKTNLETVILRAPLVYGPYVKGNFLTLLEACARQKVLPLGAISNRRSLLYVYNLASAIAAGLNHPAATGKTFLVCDGEDLSTPDLVRRMATSLGANNHLFSLPPWLLKILGIVTGRTHAVKRLMESLQVDSSLIEKELQWSPPFTVNEGLNQTARWYFENHPPRRGPGHLAV